MTGTDLRLVLPACACWLVAALAVGLPAAEVRGRVAWLAVGLFVLAVVLLCCASAAARRAGRAGRAGRAARRAGRSGRAGRTGRAGRAGRSGMNTLSSPTSSTRALRVVPVFAVAAVCFAGGGLVCASVAMHSADRSPEALERLGGHTVVATVLVGTGPVASIRQGFTGPEPTLRLTGTITAIDAGPLHVALSAPTLVSYSGSSGDDPPPGTVVTVHARLTAADPGDSVAYLLYAEGPPTRVRDAPWYLVSSNALRETFRRNAAALPGAGAQLVPGLAIGDVSAVSDELDQHMIDSGLSHLTAVSGANCAIVVAAIMLLGAAVGLSRLARVIASLAVMVGFVVLVSPSASVLRAAVMATIVLVVLASGRSPRGLPALAFASIVLLVVDPWMSRSYGLALSVLATGGLLLLTRPLQRLLCRMLPPTAALALAVPLAAQVACQPVLVLLSPQISSYSVVANLLAEPAAPVATVVGLLTCLAGAMVPALGVSGSWLTWVPATWIAGVATFFATAPGALIPWPGGPPGVALVILVTLSGFIALGVGSVQLSHALQRCSSALRVLAPQKMRRHS